MPIDSDKSRLSGVRIVSLIVTQTLVGDGIEENLARNVYQIWSENGELISSIDYKDTGYDAISRSFSSLGVFH